MKKLQICQYQKPGEMISLHRVKSLQLSGKQERNKPLGYSHAAPSSASRKERKRKNRARKRKKETSIAGNASIEQNRMVRVHHITDCKTIRRSLRGGGPWGEERKTPESQHFDHRAKCCILRNVRMPWSEY